MHYIIGPAYGRDYQTSKDATAAFVSGKDFKNHTIGVRGSYMNVNQLKAGDTVEIRFHNMQRATMVTCESAQAAHNNLAREQSELRSHNMRSSHHV